MILTIYGFIVTLVMVVVITYLLINLRTIKLLKAQPITTLQPSLAIIIAVRNEEEDIEHALQSLCNINYQNHRIIVVNDRSTDRTAEILQRFNHPKLSIITLDTLPHGWLGKNNALYQGYLATTEDWLLFTDADVEFHPDAINRAFSYVEKHQLDHLSILPDVRSRSTLLNSVLATFSMMLMTVIRPWDARKPNRSGFVGVGAFNLVKRAAYEQIGTHVSIKLCPVDDAKLGKIIKQAGLRQDVLSGAGLIGLEWYKTLKQFTDGLMKNSFAMNNYSITKTVFDVMGALLIVALPIPIMLLFGNDLLRFFGILLLFIQILYCVLVPPNKWWYGLMGPFAGLLMAYIVARSAYITLKQGGIYWRDTFYSLESLKKM